MICTSLQNCQVGGGGNGKGMDVILDFNAFGEDNSATLNIGTTDPSIHVELHATYEPKGDPSSPQPSQHDSNIAFNTFVIAPWFAQVTFKPFQIAIRKLLRPHPKAQAPRSKVKKRIGGPLRSWSSDAWHAASRLGGFAISPCRCHGRPGA